MDSLTPPLESVQLPDYVDPGQRPSLGMIVDYVHSLLQPWIQQHLDSEPNLESAVQELAWVQGDMGFVKDNLAKVERFLVYDARDGQESRRE